MSTILTIDQVSEICARYEGFDGPDPKCTCTRTDVDFYDTSGCERCDDKSEHNRAYRHAKYMLDIHGAQDIHALGHSHGNQDAEIERLKNAIWPGLPKFKPSPERPQQDFHEALIESFRTQHEQDQAELADLLKVCIEAKNYLVAGLVEPGRTVFWNLVNAINKAEGRA